MSDESHSGATEKPGAGMIFLLVVSWLWVGIPLAWGVRETMQTSLALFRNPQAAADTK